MKTVAESALRLQIQTLIELQKLDAEIYQLTQQLKDTPARLQALKEQFEGKKVEVQQAETRYKSVQVSRNSLETDLQAQEDAIAKANTQLSQIKTNKEYTAKISEIEGIKADKSITEEKILLSYDEADAVKAEVERAKQTLQAQEKIYLEQKAEIEAAGEGLRDRIKVLEGQRQQLVPAVDKAVLLKYQRILSNKEGVAIVPLQAGACGGCYMNVPPQVVNRIKMYDELVQCEVCIRILYLPEDF